MDIITHIDHAMFLIFALGEKIITLSERMARGVQNIEFTQNFSIFLLFTYS